ncbi:flocculation protein FLO11 isoform X1 [Drosophila subobscura]|uniref:flocculation protein FLO11 isoform X1 n=1 Tax=Drosophila subobscura TaxID=7241 RepID=UPI00155ACAA3|nr:flocculation protein FLO11 isoform X1 [Drosophila subobscura]
MQNEMNKSHRCGGSSASITVMLMLLLLSVHAAVGRPDVRPSPFALELQPPLAQTAEAFNGAEVGGQRSVDSYGNPIAGLRPIDTPDGRKVVSAQGLQFEIPTYASGITEIRQPADDLLPPHIDAIAVGLASPSDTSTDPNSFAPDQVSASASASAPAPIPATSLTPPKHSPSPTTTTVTTDVEVEQAQLVQQQQEESVQEPLVASGTLPEYIRELQRQDPDIGGPVPWTPAPNAAPLSVIAWDLLPPHLTDPATTPEPLIITEQQPTRYVQGVEDSTSHNIRLSLSSGDALTPAAPVPQQTQGQVSVVPLQRDGPEAHGTNAHVGSTTPSNAGGRFPNRQRGTAHYSTTRSTTTTARPRSTSTTQPPTTEATTTTTTTSTTRRTTTTRRPVTTTRRTTTVQPTPRSTTPLDPSTFYKLDNNEEYAYTLPPWLQEVTDPDLDVAVTFIVPTDNDQYNHTLAEDLEPPYEPFVDLNNIQLTPPPTARPPSLPTTTSSPTTSSSTPTRAPTTTTTTTTTTRRSSTLRTTKAPSIPTTHSTTQPPQKQHTTQKPQNPKLIPTTTHHTDLLDGASTPTAATAAAEENPFDSSTVPAWLRDFDYPDVGPGVPYNPDNFKEPASTQPAGGSKPNDFRPQGFEAASAATPRSPSAPLPTRAAPAAASVSSAFPSKVTLPLPGTVQGTESSSNESPEPPLVLVPPADKPSDESATSTSFAYSSTSSSVPPNPTTNSVTNFAARFDPQGIQSSAPAPTQAPKVASEDQFPPFSGGSSTDGVTKKVEYKKSDEGKVISTPISGQRKDTSTPPSNTGKYTGGFGAPAGLLRPQAAGTSGSGANTNPAANSQDSNGGIYVAGSQHEFSNTLKANRARPTVNPGRYTGGFGAPVGVLSAQAEPRPFQQAQQTQQQHSQVASPGQSPGSHSSRFGGPPGVLVPFDNVQRAGGQ